MRIAVKGGETSPSTAMLIMTYALAKDLAISPLEIYKMPFSLVQDLLRTSRAFKEMEQEELDKISKTSKNSMK